MRPHQKLEAWSKAIELVTDVYKSSEHFPKEDDMASRGRFVAPRFQFRPISQKGRDDAHKRSLHIFFQTLRARLVSWKPNLLLRTGLVISTKLPLQSS
jgi:hypothetical protein